MSVAPSLIVAVAANGIIGRDNRLPWHIPEDLRWFKHTTLGKPVIMGRRTWDSLGRPLPGRVNIVLTRQAGWSAEGAVVADSLDHALALAETLAPAAEAMVIGGAAIFTEALPRVGRLYLTEIARDYEGDTVFPAFDRSAWIETAREAHDGDPAYAFVVLERRVEP
ncbi:dihydrofolate reductase [Magnetospirillum molischianum]|uniref:Dihydrofolate reductase n=1 Tax=Magnetospirillum molischianum DSM 120 TaxID=1150626 RepID=H8FPN7_MAGML|nr:dihydrofolate reductase [Magnetospirillum molischianum]CCG40325.1 dihydrofolate reductase [Magnetospirillum molischianum DSM 120]